VLVGRGFAVLAVVTYALLVFGASVRVHGAGLSCPDWPLCFGEVIPQLDFHIFLEWGHRVLAGVISLGFLALGGTVLVRRDLRARAGGLVVAAGCVLLTQIILGGLTVLHLLAFWSVTLHLLTGNLFFSLLLLTALRLSGARVATTPLPTVVRRTALVLPFALAAQLALGGMVASQWAGLACTEWPTCNGGVWFPAFTGPVGLQLLHRFGAYLLLAVSWAFALTARRHADVSGPAWLVAAVVTLQAALGIANVFLAMPVELAIAHSGMAAVIVACTVHAVRRVLAAPAAAGAVERGSPDMPPSGVAVPAPAGRA
jgi:cytochrome c oxidase assembly protein subunit 15